MTPEAQRIAIAEACGWELLLPPHNGRMMGRKSLHLNEGSTDWVVMPAYLSDLDAMHEAEKACIYNDHATYVRFENTLIDLVEHPLHATAAQRAEAFLRTLNLWTDK